MVLPSATIEIVGEADTLTFNFQLSTFNSTNKYLFLEVDPI